MNVDNKRVTTDTELADKIVACGVGHCFDHEYTIDNFATDGQTADEFESDWRVAGAMLDLLAERELSFAINRVPFGDTLITVNYWDHNERGQFEEVYLATVQGGDPRAINEACCEALSDE